MNGKNRFVILLIVIAITGSSLFIGQGGKEREGEILYSNIVSEEVEQNLKTMMAEAGISAKRQKVLFEHIKQFNSIVKPESLVKDFEKYDSDKIKYDPYDMQDEWNEKSPNFMGYNCRITAFSLFRDYIEVSKKSEIKDDMIAFDLVALEEDPAALINENDKEVFSMFYSIVPTTLTKDLEVHFKTIQRNWAEKGIKFIENKKASLISVVFHESMDKEDNYLFVGHTGVLFDYKDKIYFLEKIAFQEPYQLTEFHNREELKNYIMTKYNVDFEQPTAAPFIMENDKLLDINEISTIDNQ